MQGNGGRGDPFSDFGGPFAGFGGFGGFGGRRSLVSSFFGGRDPFDDPFFTQPFGGMLNSNFFGSMPHPLLEMHPAGFVGHRTGFVGHPEGFVGHRTGFVGHPEGFVEHHAPPPKRSRGPIIEELNSDDEKEDGAEERQVYPRKHVRSSDSPRVEDPNSEIQGRSTNSLQTWNDYNKRQSERQSQPQGGGHSFSFQSSTVTYGGTNGAYYTSSTTRRTGSDGVTYEESKEADGSTMQATHRVSKGLHDKGHSITRKLKSDGKVERMETLHNLNQDDVVGFEEAWKRKARKHLPGWTEQSLNYDAPGVSSMQASQGGWALPSTERPQVQHPQAVRMTAPKLKEAAGSSQFQHPSQRSMAAQTAVKSSHQFGGRTRGSNS